METNARFAELKDVPALTLENFLFLKIENDGGNYDPDFIVKHMVRKHLPTPLPLPDWYWNKRLESRLFVPF
jgi:hypothetical protein